MTTEIFSDPNVNQFVNQGYNNIDFTPSPNQGSRSTPTPQPQFQQPAGQNQFQQQPAGVRIIPIKVEGAASPQSEPSVVMKR